MAQIAMSRLFRQSTTGSVRQSILRPMQARSYGSNSVIPTFTSTSSPELDEALERFRNELFIPLALPKRQRKSVFREKYAKQLENEPITVKIGETEEFTLTPKKHHDLPSKKDALEVLKLMVATKNYSNLFPYLSGLRMSNYAINSDRWEFIIRKTSAASKLSTIIECAKQSHRTGLTLSNRNIARRLFFELHKTAAKANFEGAPTVKALKLAREAASLMDADEHSVRNLEDDPKHQPFVIGTLLELSAACAKIDETQIGLVRSYSQKLDAAWSRGNFQDDASTGFENIERVEENLAVYNGMRLALELPRASHDTGNFQARCDKLKPILISQLEKVKNADVLADNVVKQLLADKPKQKIETNA
ncbi:hypothetical protein DTO013E5_5408 [Penicillium roqueforti]|uniref:Genomic scaffold, ProqFM164S04 n=1 Tax=Penicillium roqueforti (strain FM164) TaxID=1365484 RepID=W6QIR9_PENRF|nr:uncharacterized protein LCP9604111_3472 [Penicillium roqueforti]CDM35896.1 unnamed protein product [Penicillium roqueforti FM164]KAF9250570.1 hypothetical protein LCP9604111_3472 [Penicillium roqueforti]KAI1829970.1 hypothetical protein CBS147337_9194 [Penicillium roqueforti]KAI2672650.1 hypothetical protein CBS147355_7977 [Penicillium roqueforti]KAI2678958.1 hypothetical protein LCP963914a_7537 [Penicillium roqueforti]